MDQTYSIQWLTTSSEFASGSQANGSWPLAAPNGWLSIEVRTRMLSVVIPAAAFVVAATVGIAIRVRSARVERRYRFLRLS